METSGNRLKKIRQSLGLSQQDIASLIGTSKSYISQVEKDQCKFSIESLVKLLLNYGININYLLAGVGEPFLPPQYKDVKDEFEAKVIEIMKKQGLIK